MQIEDKELLEMALVGFGMRLAEIDRQISEVRARLAIGNGDTLPVGPGGAEWPVRFVPRERLGKRGLSPEGRARIVAATRKRWAAYRREQKARLKALEGK